MKILPAPLTIAQIAGLVGGEALGTLDNPVTGVADLADGAVKPGENLIRLAALGVEQSPFSTQALAVKLALHTVKLDLLRDDSAVELEQALRERRPGRRHRLRRHDDGSDDGSDSGGDDDRSRSGDNHGDDDRRGNRRRRGSGGDGCRLRLCARGVQR